jgi:hypothetical protein
MPYALIAKNEKIKKDGREIGCQIVEIAFSPFEVHEDLFWTKCNDDVTSHAYYFEPSRYQILPMT